MSEIYQTTLTISAVPEGDKVNFSVTNENDENAPEFIGTRLTGIIFLLGNVLYKSYVPIIQEFPELENQFRVQLTLTFENEPELPMRIEGTGMLAVFFGNAIQAYMSGNPDFLEFMNS